VSTDLKTAVWIASYPKSGNTWVRFMLCNLLFGAQSSAASLNALAPDLHELGTPAECPRERTLLKTHFCFSPALPLAAHTAAAIYIVRHPADVLLSNYHYSRRSGSSAIAEDRAAFMQYFERYIEAGGDPRWIKLGMGTWEQNVSSWTRPQEFPVLTLRYEDLLTDAPAVLEKVCRFLALERSREDISRAAAGASFERMRAIEEADIRAQRVGIFYKPYLREPIEAGLRFMRAGRNGEAARILSLEQQQSVQRTFGPMMLELGYRG
jgi:hypothetical protein